MPEHRPVRLPLVLLDRFGAPRVVSAAGDAGGLIGSSDVAGWLRFLALECPSCAGEVDWPEPEARPPAD